MLFWLFRVWATCSVGLLILRWRPKRRLPVLSWVRKTNCLWVFESERAPQLVLVSRQGELDLVLGVHGTVEEFHLVRDFLNFRVNSAYMH